MPELPEVETVARQLAPLVESRRIERLEIRDRKLRPARTPEVAGKRIARVFRLGKRVIFALEGGGGPLYLAVHLRMTGRLIYDAAPSVEPIDHLRARLHLDRGAVHFIDTRRFGTLEWFTNLSDAEPDGMDPTSDVFTQDALAGLVRGSRQALKTWLLRQDKLVGLGNIYASEILHLAQLSPRRAAGSLRRPQIAALHDATRSVLTRAIENCGTTFSDFQDAHGVTGEYQNLLQVYGREGEPCPRCARAVRRIVQGQRSTYYCTRCQR